MRAFTCYQNQGMLAKAKQALQDAVELGDETAQKQVPWVDQMLSAEEYA